MGFNGCPMFTINPSISLYVSCDSACEVDRIWNVLIDGGSVYMPLDTYPWSDRYGWLRDKFGMTWQIFSTGIHNGELNIAASPLFTNKRFGEGEAALNHYRTIFENSATDVLVRYPDGHPNAGKLMF